MIVSIFRIVEFELIEGQKRISGFLLGVHVIFYQKGGLMPMAKKIDVAYTIGIIGALCSIGGLIIALIMLL
jgi:hypothetical protein